MKHNVNPRDVEDSKGSFNPMCGDQSPVLITGICSLPDSEGRLQMFCLAFPKPPWV